MKFHEILIFREKFPNYLPGYSFFAISAKIGMKYFTIYQVLIETGTGILLFCSWKDDASPTSKRFTAQFHPGREGHPDEDQGERKARRECSGL